MDISFERYEWLANTIALKTPFDDENLRTWMARITDAVYVARDEGRISDSDDDAEKDTIMALLDLGRFSSSPT